MQFQAEAEVGNANGVFDAAYDFGDGKVESELTGTPEQIGQAITRYLSALQAEDCEAMRYGTEDFFVRFTVRPLKAADIDRS